MADRTLFQQRAQSRARVACNAAPVQYLFTILWQYRNQDEDHLFLRPTKPPPSGINEDLYQTLDAYNFTKAQLAPKRRVRQAALLGVIGGILAAVTLIEAFAKACN